jgi:hypothetical protein
MNITEAQQVLGVAADGVFGPRTAAALAVALLDRSRRPELLKLRLSPNFTLGELTRSATADARGLANMPNAAQLLKLHRLCHEILEPVRAQFGPVKVTSGFRCFTPESQHGEGEAADFEVPGVPNLTVAIWIRDHLPFDQLILEAWSPGDPNAGWIHCSYRDGRLRHSVLRTPTGRAPYFAGLPA